MPVSVFRSALHIITVAAPFVLMFFVIFSQRGVVFSFIFFFLLSFVFPRTLHPSFINSVLCPLARRVILRADCKRRKQVTAYL